MSSVPVVTTPKGRMQTVKEVHRGFGGIAFSDLIRMSRRKKNAQTERVKI
jgi:hypothetical protein